MIKSFENARVQFGIYDVETDETHNFSLSNLVEDAEDEKVEEIYTALDTIVDGQIDFAKVTQTHRIVV
ncbi:hypothetical protein AAK882_08515 [Carnobacteriaceae bacterium 52-44]